MITKLENTRDLPLYKYSKIWVYALLKNVSVLMQLLVFAFFSKGLSAEQLLFNKTLINNKTKFEYKWLDSEQKQQELSFELATKNVNNDFRHFKALTPSRLKMYSIKKLKQAIAKIDPRKGTVKITPSYQGVEFEFRSTSNEWMQEQSKELHDLYESSLKDYLRKEYYIEFEPIGYSGSPSTISYKPDHVRFAEEGKDSLKPLVKQLKRKLRRSNARRTSSYLLSWLQTIPYSTLESRTQSNGSGFSPPIRVIANNKGDCDSKVTLMATLLRAIYPRLRIAIIYVPNHALIGINVSHLNSDYRLQIEGLDYTLAEPTGPGLIKFAEVSDSSRRYIDSGIYKVEHF